MNKIIEELYDKIDAQDKIINERALEIARLKKQLNCKERLTKIMPPDTEFIILSKSDYERQEKDVEEIALELRDKIDKAIDMLNLIIPELWNISNAMAYKIKEVKRVLGDKE